MPFLTSNKDTIDIAPRPTRRPLQTEVVGIERLTPQMFRVVVTGDDLADFPVGDFTDHYVKVMFPGPDADYSAPFDVERIKAAYPKEQWPRVRSYTVRAWDPEQRHLTLDFVYHGDVGVGGPWVVGAKPGDTLQLLGPGGGYAPRDDSAWHLLVGDECVIPAIAVTLERLPAGRPVHVVIEVENAAEEQALSTAADAQVTWVHRSSGDEDGLLHAVQALELATGPYDAFLHGEATTVRQIRKHLLVDRSLDADRLSVSGYWKQSRTDEGWRAEKAEWLAAAAADVA